MDIGMILFYAGVALLAVTAITAVIFRRKPLQYELGTAAGQVTAAPAPVPETGDAPAAAGMTAPMEAAETAPMAAAATVPMSAGATVPMGQVGATVPMSQSVPPTTLMDAAGQTVPMEEGKDTP